MKKAVYYFCYNFEDDSVAPRVFDYSVEKFKLKETGLIIDDYPVMEFKDNKGNLFTYVRTSKVISHDYEHYLPVMNEYFSEYDFAGVVNWHGGDNAPDKLLCLHTIGDVPSGNFAPSNPLYTTNLARSMEQNRKVIGLDDFRVTMEATHWSGIIDDDSPELITKYNVPLVDIEIGSTNESYANEKAVEILAVSIVRVFDNEVKVPTILYVGGIHFEEPITSAILNENYHVGATHILPNIWLTSGVYSDDEGYKKLEACVDSIIGGIDGIVFQEKLKGPFKEQCRKLATALDVPIFKHKQLKNLEDSPIADLYNK